MNYLPHRHTYKSVARFVPYLETLITNHKTFGLGVLPVEINPVDLGLNISTTIARLHDAIHSLRFKLTTDPRINPDELHTTWSYYKITSDGNKLFIVPRVAEQALPIVSSQNDTNIVLTADQTELIAAFALILSHRLLQGEVTINGQLDPNFQQNLLERHDIVISLTGPQQYTMF